MRIVSLSFGRTARTPAQRGLGMTLATTREPDKHDKTGLIIHGACRVKQAELPQGRVELPQGLVLIAINPVTQIPACVPLLGDRLAFDDDVEVDGADFVASFQCVVEPYTSMSGPFLLHGSFRQYLSNVLWVDYRYVTGG